MVVRTIARPMLASVFIVSGIDALRHPTGRAEMSTALVDRTRAVLPQPVAGALPSDPVTLVRLNGAVHVGAGLALAAGKAPRLAAAALAATLLPTTAAGHAFWEENDPTRRAAQRTQFLKNLGLCGGLLIAAVDKGDKPSVARRAAKSATESLGGAAAGAAAGAAQGSAALRETLAETAQTAGSRAGDLASTAGSRAGDLASTAGSRAGDLASTARRRGAEWASEVAEEAPEYRRRARLGARRAGARARRAAELARSRAAELTAGA